MAREEWNDWVDHYGVDALGNVRWVYGTNNAWPNYTVNWDVSDYYPFGGERVIQANSNNDRKFTGKERDSESGNDNFGARFYSSQFGRFLSPDPENAGADASNPESWNAYAYVLGNPLNLTDPDGLGPCDNDPNQCVEVTASAPGPIDPFFFRLSDELSKISQRANDYLHIASQWLSAPRNMSCLVGATQAGFASGFATGATIGLAGGPFAGVTVPGGAGTGGLIGTTAGWAIGMTACRTGNGSGTGGGGRGNSQGAGRTSPNQMNQQVQRGQAPNSVDRVDSPRFPHEQPHIEFKDGNALNIDGTWKHGGRALTNEEASWISSNGWSLPR